MSEATTWMVSLGRHGFLVSVIVLLVLEWMTDDNLATGCRCKLLVGKAFGSSCPCNSGG
ncbi:MAG TPA: hypothetical protein QGE93_00375 [Acidobacteriota bacterium]|nr:hypothetical protein [Acidobacteriota bacterium]